MHLNQQKTKCLCSESKLIEVDLKDDAEVLDKCRKSFASELDRTVFKATSVCEFRLRALEIKCRQDCASEKYSQSLKHYMSSNSIAETFASMPKIGFSHSTCAYPSPINIVLRDNLRAGLDAERARTSFYVNELRNKKLYEETVSSMTQHNEITEERLEKCFQTLKHSATECDLRYENYISWCRSHVDDVKRQLEDTNSAMAACRLRESSSSFSEYFDSELVQRASEKLFVALSNCSHEVFRNHTEWSTAWRMSIFEKKRLFMAHVNKLVDLHEKKYSDAHLRQVCTNWTRSNFFQKGGEYLGVDPDTLEKERTASAWGSSCLEAPSLASRPASTLERRPRNPIPTRKRKKLEKNLNHGNAILE